MLKLNPLNLLRGMPVVAGIVILFFLYFMFSRSIFYAEPGFVYHVRTITGAEEVVSDVGYQFYPFGRWNSWKRAMTVQASREGIASLANAESEGSSTSASMPPQNIT